MVTKIADIAPENGGYPFRYIDFERKPLYLPFDVDEFNVDAESAKELIMKEKPKSSISRLECYFIPTSSKRD